MGFAAQVFAHLPGSPSFRKRLKFFYFDLMARIGLVQSPALFSLDRKAEPYLPAGFGVFVEVGANDGVSQSNTWFFERYKGWTGLLIEPVPALAAMASRFRRAPVANVALGAADGGRLELSVSDLTTTADTGRIGADAVLMSVPIRALSSLLDEHGLSHIDFFSLDVEGLEVEVLRGLDLTRHRPGCMLVETADINAVLAVLSAHYRLETKLTFHDYLLRAID
ncbi:MAG: FkbM family methyltransferase [Pseudomonadota bacterium]